MASCIADSILRFAIVCALAAGIVGALVYKFSPSDLERADADIKKARVLILSLEEEALQQRDRSTASKPGRRQTLLICHQAPNRVARTV